MEFNIEEISITGIAQSFSLGIEGDANWSIRSTTSWLHPDISEGTGPKTVTVSADENLDESREGILYVSWGNQDTRVQIKQSSVFSQTEEEVRVRTFFGYADSYELSARMVRCSLSDNLAGLGQEDRQRYLEMIPQMEHELNQKTFAIEPTGDGFIYLVPGFSLKVNGKPVPFEFAIYINQDWVEDQDKKSITHYQDMLRADFLSLLQQSILNHSMLASWPGWQEIRFETAVSDESNTRYYLGKAQQYDIEPLLEYSLFHFEKPTSTPSIGANEYSLVYDRFEGRRFMDDDKNEYEIHVVPKKLQDLASIDIELEKEICPYTYSSNSTYPVVRIDKNGELFYELVAFMYVEWLGESLNTGDEAYCTGFESVAAIDRECIRIDFDSGVDDDSIPWFDFQKTRHYDYHNGSFQQYEIENTRLYPLNDEGKKPLAGIGKPAPEQG